MSAKFIYTLSDESPDLQKQIGCMNGIFQLFDRRHFLHGGRRPIGHTAKMLPPENSKSITEPKGSLQKTTDKSNKTFKEKQRISTESSRTSFSTSSRSSSISSLECSKASQLESSSFSQTTVTEADAWDFPTNQHKGSLRSNRPFDLRDAVKDSIYRQSRGISVKTATKREAGGQILKYIDSPRPSQPCKSLNSKDSGMRESFRVLHKLQEAPSPSSEDKNGSLTSAPKHARRFSWDGRESRETLKSTIKIKELPRLSLDSKAGSTRSSTAEMKPNVFLGDLTRGNRTSNNSLNEPETYRRVSSVVTKLMGLEALPDPMSTSEHQTPQIKAQLDAEKDPLGSPRLTAENKGNQICCSPRNPHTEPASPRLKNVDSVKKPNKSSNFPLEPAPWRHSDASRGSQTSAMKSSTPQTKAPNSSLSVYGEIEKRLAQLEFKKSGKDLRALKQILEAMQKTKEILETRDEVSVTVPQTTSNNIPAQDPNTTYLPQLQGNTIISATSMSTVSPRSFKSPIVIMKPAKHNDEDSNLSSSVNTTYSPSGLHRLQSAVLADGRKESAEKQTPRTKHLTNTSNQPLHPTNKSSDARMIRFGQTSNEPQSTSRESVNSGKSIGATKLWRSQNKPRLDKQSYLKTPSDSKARKQPNRQQLKETGSPRSKPRPRSPNLQPSDDHQSDTSNEYSSQLGDGISLSESNLSFATQVDEEVSSIARCEKTNRVSNQQADYREKNPFTRLTKDTSIAGQVKDSSEQPSPVSVLDSFYSDEFPSPVKKISIAFKDEEVENSDETEWIPGDGNHPSSSPKSILNSAINHTIEDDIQLSVENLKKMMYAHAEPIADITSLYNTTNPDHQYIAQVILVSGIQKDYEPNFTAFHLHRTSYPINPNLFFALEQVHKSSKFVNDENRGRCSQSEPLAKLQRKLIFDVVNETLVNKFLFQNSSRQWPLQNMLVAKGARRQQIIRELCSEVDRLQGNSCSLDDEEEGSRSILWTDLMDQAMDWTAFQDETPGLVLDVERLIFKDLITEVVTGETIARQRRSAGHCRQLFSK